ncbi:transmembrane protein 14C [Patella vulgata]|uniref:transmembrane protein 14C n=1 Tax=Patella vulgata TaxID=6465 RepID=UPI00217FBB63|nr:transmembrane protein 14C [Patella vulgata]
MPVDFLAYGYAATVAAGGIIGYVKAGSVPSLVMGLACGSLLGFGAYQTSNDPKNVAVSLATSGLLMGVMGFRYMNSGKFMPAGLVASLSFLMLARLSLRLIKQ